MKEILAADHQVVLTKLNHYAILRVSNDWFNSYPSNHNQFVSIKGCDSGLAVPPRSCSRNASTSVFYN